jgi:hypothetical protein
MCWWLAWLQPTRCLRQQQQAAAQQAARAAAPGVWWLRSVQRCGWLRALDR